MNIPYKAVFGRIKEEASHDNSSEVTFHSTKKLSNTPHISTLPASKPRVQAVIHSNKNSTRNKAPYSKFTTLASSHSSTKNSRSTFSNSYDNKLEKKTINLINASKKEEDTDNHNLDSLIMKAKNKLEDTINSKFNLQTSPKTPEIMKNFKSSTSNSQLQSDASPNKWKQFGLLMADAYEELKLKYKQLIENNVKTQQINEELTLQNQRLKTLLNYKQKENCIETIEKQKNQIKILLTDLQTKEKENEILLNELNINTSLSNAWENKYITLKEEHCKCNQPQESNSAEYYKQLYQKHLNQCSSLAEQLICLRSDMDKSTPIITKSSVLESPICSSSKQSVHSSNVSMHREHKYEKEELPLPINEMPRPYKNNQKQPSTFEHPRSNSLGDKNSV